MQVEKTETRIIQVKYETCQHKCCEAVVMTLGEPMRAMLTMYRDKTYILTIPGLAHLALTITRANAIEVMKQIKPVTEVKIWRTNDNTADAIRGEAEPQQEALPDSEPAV